MNWRIREKVTGAIAALALGGFAPGAAAAAEFEWRVDSYLVETRPESEQLKLFAERVKDRSGGRIELKLFFGESQGIKAADSLRALSTGAVEMAMLYGGYYGRDAPDVASAFPQGILLSRDEAAAIQPTLHALYGEAYADWGIVTVGWLVAPVFDISVLCREPVGDIAALKGKRLRVWSRDQVDTFANLEVPAQIIGQNDLYLALQTGVVDCALYVLGIAHTVSLQEVTDSAAYLHTFSAIPNALGVNRAQFEALPPDLQEVMREAGAWITQQALDGMLDNSAEEKARADFQASGAIQVLAPFPEADRVRFYETASAVWEKQVDEIGGKAPGYRMRVIEALQAIRAD